MALIDAAALAPFGLLNDSKTAAMLEDAIAQALTVAPCLANEEALNPVQKASAKATLRAAIVRWHEAGSGAKVTHSQGAGPFSESETYDTSHQRKGAFWPSEITMLQSICKSGRQAYTVDMSGHQASPHQPWCAVVFGANYCSCGADIAGSPIYE